MAKAPGGIMGRQTGRIGEVVIDYYDGRQIIKSRKRKIDDAKSPAQIEQRAKYTNAVSLYRLSKLQVWQHTMADQVNGLTLYMNVMKLITTHMVDPFPITPNLRLSAHPDPIIIAGTLLTSFPPRYILEVTRDWARANLNHTDWDFYGICSIPDQLLLFFDVDVTIWSGTLIRVRFSLPQTYVGSTLYGYICGIKKDKSIITGTGFASMLWT